MSKSDHDHSSPARAGYEGKARPYGISEADNREYERGRLAREAEERKRYRDNWGGDAKRG